MGQTSVSNVKADVQKVLVDESSRTEQCVLESLTGQSCTQIIPHAGGDPLGVPQHRSDVGREAARALHFPDLPSAK